LMMMGAAGLKSSSFAGWKSSKTATSGRGVRRRRKYLLAPLNTH
jgi:hypothetical protein